MRRKNLFSLGTAIGLWLAVCSTACMKVPGEIQTQFAPKAALEESHFNKRSGAPLAHTFLTSADLATTEKPKAAVPRKPESYGVPTAEELDAMHQQNVDALSTSPKPETKPQPKPEAKPEAKPESKPEAKPEEKPQPAGESK